jgi:hypothetical protein
MTATTSPASRANLPSNSALVTVTSILAAGAMALLAIVAVSLAVAFPLVVSLSDGGRITISPADLAASQTMAGVAWLFAAVSLAHIVAALGAMTDVVVVQRIGMVVTGAGAALGLAAMTIVLRDGGTGAIDGAAILGVVAAVYLFAFAVIAIGRRAI